jgi:tetratricopeptide (TPR) repeat protein
MQGERESSPARLNDAVAAFHEALQERTRDKVPLDWAITQNNLGNALRALGKLESGTARLEEAAGAYQAALLVLRPAPAEYYTQITERNLQRVQQEIAERKSARSKVGKPPR